MHCAEKDVDVKSCKLERNCTDFERLPIDKAGRALDFLSFSSPPG